MTTLEERAPIHLFLTPTERDEVARLVDEVEAKALALAETIGDIRRTIAQPAVDLGDPLALFRLPSGAVGFETVPVGSLRTGDWFQRVHGDPGWHQVLPLIFAGDRIGVPYDEAGLEWFGVDAQVRVARPPADVVARQELREAGR